MPERGPDFSRVSVVGTSGSGKSTLARSLAEAAGVPHVELDALHWEPGWRPADPGVFRARVEQAVAGPRWVCDGNYSAVRDLVWKRATAIVWLDLPFGLVFCRAVSRTFRRARSREPLFGGTNRERVLGFLDPDWIPWWVIRTWWRNRRRYDALTANGALEPVSVVRLRSAAEVDRFLAARRAAPP